MKLLHGSPRLILVAVPAALTIVALKALALQLGWSDLALSPLLASTLGAEVFLIGFILNGTAADFREAERLPGELVASLDTIADEMLILRAEQGHPGAESGLVAVAAISDRARHWLVQDRDFDQALAAVRGLNTVFSEVKDVIQPGFLSRLRSEQAGLRRILLRMEAMARTSYVSASYLMAELIGVLLLGIMVVTDLGETAAALSLVGVVTFLLTFVLLLVRDLDDPFEYGAGAPGVADVPLDVLDAFDARMRALIAVRA